MDGEEGNIDLSEFDEPIQGEDTSRSSRNDYFKLLKDCIDPVNDLKAGLFYSFSYRPQKKEDTVNQFAFSDFSPLVFLYGPAGNDKLDTLNFHFLPVDVRIAWLDMVDSMTKGNISENRRVTIPPDMLKKLGYKLEFARRVYDVKGIKEWKRIDSSTMWDLCKMTPNTYGSANYTTIARGFNIFNPSKLVNGSRG